MSNSIIQTDGPSCCRPKTRSRHRRTVLASCRHPAANSRQGDGRNSPRPVKFCHICRPFSSLSSHSAGGQAKSTLKHIGVDKPRKQRSLMQKRCMLHAGTVFLLPLTIWQVTWRKQCENQQRSRGPVQERAGKKCTSIRSRRLQQVLLIKLKRRRSEALWIRTDSC